MTGIGKTLKEIRETDHGDRNPHALSSSDIRRKKGPEVTSFQALLPVLPKVERDQRIICGLTSGGVASFPAAPGSEN